MYTCRKSLHHLDRYTRIHMSNDIISEIDCSKYINNQNLDKPTGFWYSMGTEWLKWVQLEMPDWEKQYLYDLRLDENKILKITNLDELKQFNKTYKSEHKTFDRYYSINWDLVADKYFGIEFQNYRAIKSEYDDWYDLWFHMIDVSSGCIWNNEAVKSLTLICEPEVL